MYLFDELVKKYGPRYGKLFISREIIQKYPEKVMSITGKMIIIRAEFRLLSNGILYEAFCPTFRELEEGEAIPTYHVERRTYEKDDGTRGEEIRLVV